MKDLDEPLKSELVSLCHRAVEAQDEERYHASNRDLYTVFEKLPEPKPEWKAYVWLLSNMGDNHFEQDEFAEAMEKFDEVFELDPTASDNAYLCLRRGQCALELENEGLAADLLCKAFEIEGKEFFEGEHSKYLKFAKQASE
ncbi:tetratricopeptide repeat protein [Rubritalea marina]|uniref:tetratricopeptide repeat protein n=1 Tax=Rubritalea marina TaxID=361055 RepID=UPI00037B116E|nr:tetratricopeptide repeat protein [Rubritalea marina]